MRAAFSIRPPSIRSMVALPAAAQTGLPANVEPWAPAGQVMTESRAMNAPSGIPEAIPLAVVTISGSTPACWIAHQRPVRPMPDCTSSATRRMPCSSHSSRRARRNDAGAGK